MVSSGFPWDSIAKGAKVVDVGGGTGSVSLTVARQFPELRFIVQDTPSMIKQGEKVNFSSTVNTARTQCFQFWDSALPEALKSGRVVFQGNEFMTVRLTIWC
jgi:hypothetical protein